MKKVKFIRNTVPEREGGDGWKKGDVVTMSDGSAARWMRRSAIEVLDSDVGASAPVPAPVAVAPAPDAPDPLFDTVSDPVASADPPAAPPPAPAAAPSPVAAPTPQRTTLSVPRKQGGNHRR